MGKDFRYNRTIYNRVDHDTESHYTIISNVIVKDKRLTFIEKGLMLYLLSNADEYVINKSVVIKASGLGRKAIDKAFDNLKEYKYIDYICKNNIHTWIINEDPEYCPKSNSTKVTAEKYTHLSDVTEVALLKEQVISTKEITPEEKNTNEEINNAENNNEMQTLGFKGSSGSLELTSTDYNTSINSAKADLKDNTSRPVENDLNLILSKSQHFNFIYNQSKEWQQVDISKYSNPLIAHFTIEKEKGNQESTINSMEYNLFHFLIQYSSTVEDSNLWKEFEHQCQSEYNTELIRKFDRRND